MSTVGNNFRFPGQYYDQETGLHYNYFRDYHPGIGRYIEPDPLSLPQIQIVRHSSLNNLVQFSSDPSNIDEIHRLFISHMLYQYGLRNPQVLNLYPYVNGNSIKFVDPEGQFLFAPLLYFAAAKAVAVGTAYLGVKLAQQAANAVDACEQEVKDQNKAINQAFKMIGSVNAAQIGVVGLLNAGMAAGPAATTAALSNPAVIQNAADFMQGILVPGPPPPSSGGYFGFITKEVVDRIRQP
ncbi:MAG: hypothetical protein DRJ18_01365 [Candidatus Methanomethylicota archaeon]|nr:MAG: hypothetical protein DRJ18_01365 [Candidatus Verstraetearchaeota archaeon]